MDMYKYHLVVLFQLSFSEKETFFETCTVYSLILEKVKIMYVPAPTVACSALTRPGDVVAHPSVAAGTVFAAVDTILASVTWLGTNGTLQIQPGGSNTGLG